MNVVRKPHKIIISTSLQKVTKVKFTRLKLVAATGSLE